MSPPKALGARRASLAIALAVVAACGGATADLAPLEPDAAPGSDASVVDVALDTGGPESDASARDARDAEPEAAFDASSEDALPPLSGRARIRIANVSRYGQAYNYCYGPEGYPQIGPAPMWLQEGDVSQYFDVPAGARYVIQLRSPNASGCLPDGRPNPTLLTPLLTDELIWELRAIYDRMVLSVPDAAPYVAVIAMNWS